MVYMLGLFLRFQFLVTTMSSWSEEVIVVLLRNQTPQNIQNTESTSIQATGLSDVNGLYCDCSSNKNSYNYRFKRRRNFCGMSGYLELVVLVSAFILLGFSNGVNGTGGRFSLSITNFTNPLSTTAEGVCCWRRDSLNGTGTCSTPCRTRFRICVKNYQISIDPEGPCYIGEANTLVSTGNTFTNLGQWDFEFKFRWPGTFSLIIEAWHDETERDSDVGRRALISRLAIQQWLTIGSDWRPRSYTSNGHSFNYAYRVVCLDHYYGESCDKYCKPRDDKFGHYNCSVNGDVVCDQGWDGEYCMGATCSPGCTHGSCTSPNKCTCPLGYTGPQCEQCQTYPGCKHGTCTSPWQCECSEGWGGLFCNQDLNYCTNHKPCKNGGTCFNTGQGSYTCSCTPGFAGGDCSKKADEVCLCENGGVCEGDGTCSCGVEWGGARCEVRVGCTCENGGVCNGGVCICPMGTSGPHCEKLFCNGMPCLNGASCNETSRTCVCAQGSMYSKGPNCSCACLNGGKCSSGGSSCICPAEYTGPLCSFPNATYTLGMLKTFEEELSYEHVVLVIVASVTCPLLILIGVSVVVVLKRRRVQEMERLHMLATLQNEENSGLHLRKGFDSNTNSSSNTTRPELQMVMNVNLKTKDSNLWQHGQQAQGGGKIYEKGGGNPLSGSTSLLNTSHVLGNFTHSNNNNPGGITPPNIPATFGSSSCFQSPSSSLMSPGGGLSPPGPRNSNILLNTNNHLNSSNNSYNNILPLNIATQV